MCSELLVVYYFNYPATTDLYTYGHALSLHDALPIWVIDAQGKPLTPALFGGITGIGIEEVSGEDRTTDNALALGAGDKDMVVRPEFDVTLAYNPDSVLVPVTRVEGIGFTLLGAGSSAGGSIIGGQGAVVRLDGGPDPLGPRVLLDRK